MKKVRLKKTSQHDRMLREVTTLARLEHLRIVRYHSGETPSTRSRPKPRAYRVDMAYDTPSTPFAYSSATIVPASLFWPYAVERLLYLNTLQPGWS